MYQEHVLEKLHLNWQRFYKIGKLYNYYNLCTSRRRKLPYYDLGIDLNQIKLPPSCDAHGAPPPCYRQL